MIRLDGSSGEGGGQILRSSLALSVLTGKAFEMVKIRAGRSKPGLRTQHLTCVRAAQAISAAQVAGDGLNSQDLIFEPQTLVGGHYHFEQPGAGSTMLVLQTVLLPLLLADAPSVLTLTGGTHNPMAPPYEFITESYLPCLQQMGAKVTPRLDRAGFFPAGGGRCRFDITPIDALQPLHLPADPGHQRHAARVLISNLPEHIAQREAEALKGSAWQAADIDFLPGQGPGNLMLLYSLGEPVSSLHAGFGERRKSAEQVAKELVARAKLHLDSGLPVEEHLADQLLLPMALAGSGSFYTSTLSEHTRTNIETIQHFLDIAIEVETYAKGKAKGWKVSIGTA